MAAYLTLRHLEPLSAAGLGSGKSTARSERNALLTLRTYEAGQEKDWRAPRTAIWALLDFETTNAALDNASDTDLPGLDTTNKSTRQASVGRIIRRHLEEIGNAYPLAYKASGLADKDTLLQVFSSPSDYVAAISTMSAVPPVAATKAKAGWASQGSGVLVAFSLTNGTIMDINIDGRGQTLLGTQGHHVTAHVAVVRSITRAITNQTRKDAGDAMWTLVGSVSTCRPFHGGK